MSKTLEIIICAFLMLALATFLVMAIWVAEQTRAVTSILKLYNNAIVQCKDDACRQYMTTFYIRVLRDLTSEVKNDNRN